MYSPVVFILLLFSASIVSALSLSTCWKSSLGVNASYGPLKDLRIDAINFCHNFSSNPLIVPAGSFIFGFQSAMWIGNFSSLDSCTATFNQIVSDCYGSANPVLPVTLGGNNTDSGGANLAISFGTAAIL
ncbi:hypothetical protein CVT25_012389 [Psilocybe cyanescens]|uniref:Uncharacterized protein n=1 Tax=Psilocybe cyanescens TaxID=93625 RepID=A0A409X7V2_PSICY|nr:hypothetical protein CVT25_012389 [Psilocybe cyanescens]